MKNKYFWLFLRGLAYTLCLGAIIYYLYQSPYNPHPRSAEDIRNWVSGFGIMAPIVYISIYTIRPLLLFPTLILNLSAGVLFGPWWGIIFLLLGGLGCACFCYCLGRYGGGKWLLENFGGTWGERLKCYLTETGSLKKLLWLRTVPIFPYDPISIISGSVQMPLKTYVGATILGMLPGAVAYNFLADSFGTNNFYFAVALTFIAFGLPMLLWNRSKEGSFLKRDKECKNYEE